MDSGTVSIEQERYFHMAPRMIHCNRRIDVTHELYI
jgi:hypothetical protein